jgi:dTDP-4-amino-4,6-dideoxygalactose transaminase
VRNALSLPMWSEMEERTVARVADAIAGIHTSRFVDTRL